MTAAELCHSRCIVTAEIHLCNLGGVLLAVLQDYGVEKTTTTGPLRNLAYVFVSMLRDSQMGIVTKPPLKDFCCLICAGLSDQRYKGRWNAQLGDLRHLYPMARADLLNLGRAALGDGGRAKC